MESRRIGSGRRSRLTPALPHSHTPILFALLLLLLFAAAAFGATTIDPTNHYAYSANTGWLEFRGDVTNGTVIGRFYCTGYVYSANCGWIGLGNGPTNGWEYGNATEDDWGVNHDGLGNLEGLAYGANIGWINFEQTHGQPRLDLITGKFSGYAWSANTGWISLSNIQAHVATLTLEAGPDTDGDGLPDAWELREAGDLATLSGSGHDEDGDGLTDTDEYLADTDPLEGDSLLVITHLAGPAGDTNLITWTCEPTRFYQLESTNAIPTNSAAWQSLGSPIGPIATPTTTAENHAPGQSQLFYRVEAIVPLAP